MMLSTTPWFARPGPEGASFKSATLLTRPGLGFKPGIRLRTRQVSELTQIDLLLRGRYVRFLMSSSRRGLEMHQERAQAEKPDTVSGSRCC